MRYKKLRYMKKINEIGKRYTNLLVVALFGRDRFGRSLWKCLCDCGNETIARGYHLRQEHTRSCGCLFEQARWSLDQLDEKNPNWKGEKISYGALHNWVRARKGRPADCIKCGTNRAKLFHWANISGKYLRDLNDYQSMCPSCHKKFDLQRKNLVMV